MSRELTQEEKEEIKQRISKINTPLIEMLSDIKDMNVNEILNYGLAETTLHFCFEHALAVFLWAKPNSFNPVNYGSNYIIYCDIKHCSKPAVLQAKLNVYIAKEVID